MKFQLCASLATDQRPRPGTRRSARPARPRFVARLSHAGELMVVDLIRRAAAQRSVWPRVVVPSREQIELCAELISPEWNERQPRAVLLDRLDRSFDDGNAAVLADGPVARRTDASTFAPASKRVAIELRSTIADDVLRFGAGYSHRASEEATHRQRRRRLLEGGRSHGTARELIDDDGHPPAERPTLR